MRNFFFYTFLFWHSHQLRIPKNGKTKDSKHHIHTQAITNKHTNPTGKDIFPLSKTPRPTLGPTSLIFKAVLLQACSGPQGSGKLSFQDLMTTAQDSGKVVSLTHRPPLTPGNAPVTHFC